MARRTVGSEGPREPPNGAEAIREAVTGPTMRFDPAKTTGWQAAPTLHKTGDLPLRQRPLTTALRAPLAKRGVIAVRGPARGPAGRRRPSRPCMKIGTHRPNRRAGGQERCVSAAGPAPLRPPSAPHWREAILQHRGEPADRRQPPPPPSRAPGSRDGPTSRPTARRGRIRGSWPPRGSRRSGARSGSQPPRLSRRRSSAGSCPIRHMLRGS